MKEKEINGVTVDSSPDSNGFGWYVGIVVGNESTWIYPEEARKLAKLLVKAAKRPKKKKTKK